MIQGKLLKPNSKIEFVVGKPPYPAGYLPSIPFNSMGQYIDPDVFDNPNGGKKTKLGGMAYPIILGDPNKTVNEYIDNQGKKQSFQTVSLDCAICSVDFNPKVVLTEIQGLPYTIKEFISSGDNGVTITGIYNSTPNIAPMDFIRNMNDIFSASIPIQVTNYYLNELGIYYIVVMSGTNMGQQEGGYSIQTFTIKCISDEAMTTILP